MQGRTQQELEGSKKLGKYGGGEEGQNNECPPLRGSY